MAVDYIVFPFFSFVFDKIKWALTYNGQQLQPVFLSRACTEHLPQRELQTQIFAGRAHQQTPKSAKVFNLWPW